MLCAFLIYPLLLTDIVSSIFGDSMNVASRMESTANHGRIQVRSMDDELRQRQIEAVIQSTLH